NAVAGSALLRDRPGPTVVTPHPGEMARLQSGDTARVQADRLGAARAFARAERVVVVLKGARTIIASPDGATAICPTGNPGMASGGMGDVLSGVIGALLAQGLAAYDAAALGVFAHGAAGDAVAARQGETGLLASDLLAELPVTLERLQAAARPDAPRDQAPFLRDVLYGEGVAAVEWFDRLGLAAGDEALLVTLRFTPGGGRAIRLEARGARHESLLAPS